MSEVGRVFKGCVEDRNDPLMIGRCRVRITGIHTQDKNILPTKDLPWATSMVPITYAGTSGIGSTPVGPQEGTWVYIMFNDVEQQQPMMMGGICGIPQSKQAQMVNAQKGNIFTEGGKETDATGSIIGELSGAVQGIINAAEEVAALPGEVVGGLNDIVNAAEGAVQGCVDEAIAAAEAAVAAVVEAINNEINELISDALDAFGDIPQIAAITGAFRSISNMVGGVRDEVTGAIAGIVNTEKGIASAISGFSCTKLVSGSQMMSAMEDRSSNETSGFCDPTAKYPLRNYMDEADTNRLGRGKVKGTTIEYQDLARSVKIPKANSTETWEQPPLVYSGKYPYSHVQESEAGHVKIVDNNPGFESVTHIHRKGTYDTVDPNGTKVTKIVGDSYTIIDRNGSIYIDGRCDVAVGNSCNVVVQGDANLQVYGTSNLTFHGNLNVGAANNVNFAVGGDFNINADGNVAIRSKKSLTAKGLITSVESGTILSLRAATVVAIDGLTFQGQGGMAARVPELSNFLLRPPAKSKGRKDKYKPLKVEKFRDNSSTSNVLGSA
jgi:hypothetical protein